MKIWILIICVISAFPISAVELPPGMSVFPFANHSTDSGSEYLQEVIQNTLEKELSGSALFSLMPYQSIRLDRNTVSSDDELRIILIEKGVEYLLEGSYHYRSGRMLLTLWISDLLDQKRKIRIEKKSQSGDDLVLFIRTAFQELMSNDSGFVKKRSSSEILFKRGQAIHQIKLNRMNQIRNLSIIFKGGLYYSSLILIPQEYNPDSLNIVDITRIENRWQHFASADFSFELLSKIKSNSVGFVFNAVLPFYLSLPAFMSTVIKINGGLVLGFRNDYYFLITFGGVYHRYEYELDYEKIHFDGPFEFKHDVFSFDLSLIFRYLPVSKPFFFSAGFGFHIPFEPQFAFKWDNSQPVIIWNRDLPQDRSFFFPVSIKAEGGFFINKNLGFYMNTGCYLYFIDYNYNVPLKEYLPFTLNGDNSFGFSTGLRIEISTGIIIRTEIH